MGNSGKNSSNRQSILILNTRWHIVECKDQKHADQINKTFGQSFDLAYHFWCGSGKRVDL